MRTTLTMTAGQHQLLRRHLLPGDGLEAVALALCGRRSGDQDHRLLMHEVMLIPHEHCQRSALHITWPSTALKALLERAARYGMAVLKIHSHPGGHPSFSEVDDLADAELFPSIHACTDDGLPHASAVMLPDGMIFGRAHMPDGSAAYLESVTVLGDTIIIWRVPGSRIDPAPEFAVRHVQAFGAGTFAALRGLRIAVVGCSGTGSVIIDQLARLGVGRLILVDPDRVETKNLNRILNATAADVGRLKVVVQRRFVNALGIGTEVESHPCDLGEPAAWRAVAGADVVFGCMDSVDGRHLLNRLATFYLLPYIDVGIRLDADGVGGVDQVCGSVHYLQPGLSTLRTREVFTEEQLRAAGMKRFSPEAYEERQKEGYIRGIEEDRPAVNGVNMFFSALAVLELLARLHPYRDDPNAECAGQTISLTGGFWLRRAEAPIDEGLARHVGRGDMVPFLGMPFLAAEAGAAT
ncbi:MAG: ThiF family adenylyltransferase [Alphaproteobacteria bacterium]|nr:ThiF family adenylyltransferase [Alphaproteobacteria bacterium]